MAGSTPPVPITLGDSAHRSLDLATALAVVAALATCLVVGATAWHPGLTLTETDAALVAFAVGGLAARQAVNMLRASRIQLALIESYRLTAIALALPPEADQADEAAAIAEDICAALVCGWDLCEQSFAEAGIERWQLMTVPPDDGTGPQ